MPTKCSSSLTPLKCEVGIKVGEEEGGGMPLVCARELGGRWVRKGGGGIMATLCPTYKG